MGDRKAIWELSHDLVEAICASSPTNATFAGVKGHDHRWDDVSPAGLEARLGVLQGFRARLAKASASSDPDAELAREVMGEYLDERCAFLASDDRFRDLNNITSTFQSFSMVFDVMDVASDEGRAAVAARLAAMPEALSQYRALLAEGIARDAVVAKRQVRAAAAQGRSQARIFHDVATRAELSPTAADAAADAMADLVTWLEQTYLPHAAEADGVGREAYVRAARQHLGLDLDLEETYRWGFDEIRRIDCAMAEIAETIAPGLSVAEVARRLDAPETGERLAVPGPFIAAMEARQRQALAALAETHFDVPEVIRRLDVKLAPPGGKVGAYYTQPSEDFSRAGCVWYATGSASTMPIWQEISTAYHEGFPGHHLQVGLQVHLRDRLSRFQRMLAFWPGSSEGWALYAEQLMLELGYFERPEYALGMYAAQLMRAARVVVDIGLHLGLAIPDDFDFHPGEVWTHDLAVAMMQDRALMDREQAEGEVIRYLGWPGQAISYKVGQRVILDAREGLVTRGAMSLREFHSRVLALGSVGLGTLLRRLEG
jgi:uncharacterized protein (DUF885 family)